MIPAQKRALIAHELRRLQAQEMQVRDGIKLMQQQQMEFRLNMTMANRWGLVAVMSKAVLIPLHAIIGAFELRAAQEEFQHLVDAIILAVEWADHEHGHVAVKVCLKKLKAVIGRELQSNKEWGDCVPAVNILIGLAEDSADLLETAMMVSKGGNEMSAEDRALKRTIERTMERAQHALQQLQAKEARLRQLAARAPSGTGPRPTPVRLP